VVGSLRIRRAIWPHGPVCPHCGGTDRIGKIKANPAKRVRIGLHKCGAKTSREKRSNETHRSTTDPDARLYRKGDGQASRLCYMGHALMENRHGLAVGADVTHATGTAERDAGLALVRRPRARELRAQ
jgi:hypothetical protein